MRLRGGAGGAPTSFGRQSSGATGAGGRRRGEAGISFESEEGVMTELLLDAAGRRRSPATMPGFHAGRSPRNKGVRYPADPPTVEEIVAVMRRAKREPVGSRYQVLGPVTARGGCGSSRTTGTE